MALKVTKELHELRDARVGFISLVDRAATRMPLRVIKRNGDEDMGIDLSRIQKKDKNAKKNEKTAKAEKPKVVALVVNSQKSDTVNTQVVAAIKSAGFDVDKVVKNDDGTVMYQQPGGDDLTGTTIVRLSDQMVVVLKGFDPMSCGMDDSDFAATASASNYYQAVDSSLDVLFSKICSVLQDAEDEGDAGDQIGTLIDGFKTYVLGLVDNLPSEAFKSDIGVRRVIQAAQKADAGVDLLALLTPVPASFTENPEAWNSMGTNDKMTWLLDSTNTRATQKGDPNYDSSCPECKQMVESGAPMADAVQAHKNHGSSGSVKMDCAACQKMKDNGASEDDMAKAHKKHAKKGDITDINSFMKMLQTPPDGFTGNADDWAKMSTGDKLDWAAASYNEANKDGAQKADDCATCKAMDGWDKMSADDKTAAHAKHAKKDDDGVMDDDDEDDDVAEKLDQVVKGIAALANTVQSIATAQTALEKKVDSVAQKSDAVDSKLTATVAALPQAADLPNMGAGAGGEVQKKDPRSGNFDTAFLSRAQKRETAKK